MKRYAILLAVMGMLVSVPSAQAGSDVVTGTAVQDVSRATRVRQLAERVWGAAPCGTVHIEYAYPAGADTRGGAWADMPGPDQRCVVWLRPGLHPAWPIYCSIVLHEWGHLTGHEHSHNPQSVMYPSQSYSEMGGTVDGHRVATSFTGTGLARQCQPTRATPRPRRLNPGTPRPLRRR